MNVQLLALKPAHSLLIPVGSCLNHAGADAGHISVVAAPLGLWVVLVSVTQQRAWARQVEIGGDVNSIVGALMGAIPTVESMEFHSFDAFEFGGMALFLSLVPTKVQPLKHRYVVFHKSRQVMHPGTLKAAQDYVGKSPASVRDGLRIARADGSED